MRSMTSSAVKYMRSVCLPVKVKPLMMSCSQPSGQMLSSVSFIFPRLAAVTV